MFAERKCKTIEHSQSSTVLGFSQDSVSWDSVLTPCDHSSHPRNPLQNYNKLEDFYTILDSPLREGSYGAVLEGQHVTSGKRVALKRDVVVDKHENLYLVMDYEPYDLSNLVKSARVPLTTAVVKTLIHELLQGLVYLHGNNIIHRDLKLNNILLNYYGELKICDFGMAREFDYENEMTPGCDRVTLLTRAPELILGAKTYGPEVDMWAVGCILAELILGKPLFGEESDLAQLYSIFSIFGAPTRASWPGFFDLECPISFDVKGIGLAQIFSEDPESACYLSEFGIDLLSKLLCCDPDKRISCHDALEHPWFQASPLPQRKHVVEFLSTNLDGNNDDDDEYVDIFN